MAYKPILSSDDLVSRLIPGVTREDHWLDFKGLDVATGRPYPDNVKGKDDCRLDVAAFANEEGGTLVIGAEEVGHVLARFTAVPDPQERVRWIDEILKEKLEPRPAMDPYVLRTRDGEDVIAVNIPPSLRLIGLRDDDWYRFPVRTVDSKRYLTLAEVEARMQDRDRVHRLRLAEIKSEETVTLDTKIDANLSHNNWRVVRVQEDAVILKKDTIEVLVPLAYVEAVYRAGLPDMEWVIGLSCYVSKPKGRGVIIITKGLPHDRREDRYRSRTLIID